MKWPYENELGLKETIKYDVVVLGGGLSGCFAAIAAKKIGLSVAIVEKGSIGKSEDRGVYHETITKNEFLVNILSLDGKSLINELSKIGLRTNIFENGIDVFNQLKSKVLSKDLKPALLRQLRILGIKIFDRIEICGLLTNELDGKKVGCGAIGMHVRTGKTMVFEAKSIILAMSKPSRIFNFNSNVPALSESCAFQSVGSGFAIGIRSGLDICFNRHDEFGFAHDDDLKTNIDGIYVCGKQLIGCDDVLSCVSGNYAGRKAADYAMKVNYSEIESMQITNEQQRIFSSMYSNGNMSWKELNQAITDCMCKYYNSDIALGILLLEQYENEYVCQLSCKNPHDLVRIHEVLDILTISKMILHMLEARHE